jgi:hypothetical protein
MPVQQDGEVHETDAIRFSAKREGAYGAGGGRLCKSRCSGAVGGVTQNAEDLRNRIGEALP